MPTTAERLDRLEAENVDLKAEVARLKSKVEPKPEPEPVKSSGPPASIYVEPRTTQMVVLPASGPMPTDDELRELQRLVFAANPTWQHETQRGLVVDHFRQFKNAFRALGRLGRTEQLDSVHDVSWFVNLATSTVDHSMGHNDFGAEFMAAVFASGDIAYRDWNVSSPVELGLTYPGAGRSASDAWRGILAAGKFTPRGSSVHQLCDYTVGRAGGIHR